VRRPAGLAALAAVTLAAAGCGTGGIARGPADLTSGKTLFVSHCGGCHTLADAGTQGKVGPNLDDAFRYDREQGFAQSSIENIVLDQIRIPEPPMPANLVTGQDAENVAAYVASVAGK
jgi:mono/diheme cytochrome c family protein